MRRVTYKERHILSTFYELGPLLGTFISVTSFDHNTAMRWDITVVVQLLSHVWLFVTSWTAACQAPLSSTISQGLLKFMSIELMMVSNHLILCCSLLPLPSIFPSETIYLWLSLEPMHWESNPDKTQIWIWNNKAKIWPREVLVGIDIAWPVSHSNLR